MTDRLLANLNASIVISPLAWEEASLTPSESSDPDVLAERARHLIRDVVYAVTRDPLSDRITLEHRPFDHDLHREGDQVLCLKIVRSEHVSEPCALFVSLLNEPIVQLGD